MAGPFCLVRPGPRKARVLVTWTGHFHMAVPYRFEKTASLNLKVFAIELLSATG